MAIESRRLERSTHDELDSLRVEFERETRDVETGESRRVQIARSYELPEAEVAQAEEELEAALSRLDAVEYDYIVDKKFETLPMGMKAALVQLNQNFRTEFPDAPAMWGVLEDLIDSGNNLTLNELTQFLGVDPGREKLEIGEIRSLNLLLQEIQSFADSEIKAYLREKDEKINNDSWLTGKIGNGIYRWLNPEGAKQGKTLADWINSKPNNRATDLLQKQVKLAAGAVRGVEQGGLAILNLVTGIDLSTQHDLQAKKAEHAQMKTVLAEMRANGASRAEIKAYKAEMKAFKKKHFPGLFGGRWKMPPWISGTAKVIKGAAKMVVNSEYREKKIKGMQRYFYEMPDRTRLLVNNVKQTYKRGGIDALIFDAGSIAGEFVVPASIVGKGAGKLSKAILKRNETHRSNMTQANRQALRYEQAARLRQSLASRSLQAQMQATRDLTMTMVGHTTRKAASGTQKFLKKKTELANRAEDFVLNKAFSGKRKRFIKKLKKTAEGASESSKAFRYFKRTLKKGDLDDKAKRPATDPTVPQGKGRNEKPEISQKDRGSYGDAANNRLERMNDRDRALWTQVLRNAEKMNPKALTDALNMLQKLPRGVSLSRVFDGGFVMKVGNPPIDAIVNLRKGKMYPANLDKTEALGADYLSFSIRAENIAKVQFSSALIEGTYKSSNEGVFEAFKRMKVANFENRLEQLIPSRNFALMSPEMMMGTRNLMLNNPNMAIDDIFQKLGLLTPDGKLKANLTDSSARFVNFLRTDARIGVRAANDNTPGVKPAVASNDNLPDLEAELAAA